MNLARAFAASFAPDSERSSTVSTMSVAPRPPRPVLQLAAISQAVSPSDFTNAAGPANPRGDLLALRRFRDLVDPLPTFDSWYNPTASSLEEVWATIVKSANAANPLAQSILEDANLRFELSAKSPLDGVPIPWRPVYAQPQNWADLRENQFVRVAFPLDDTAPQDSAFDFIGGTQPHWESLSHWSVLDPDGTSPTTRVLDPNTKLISIEISALQVSLQRPWLALLLLGIQGVTISELQPGAVSSGSLSDNNGLLPLIPTSFIIARDVTLFAEVAPGDRAFIKELGNSEQGLSIGPFLLQSPKSLREAFVGLENGAVTSKTPQIIAWISTLVPKFPAA